MNAAVPDYLSALVVSFPRSREWYRAGFDEDFELLDRDKARLLANVWSALSTPGYLPRRPEWARGL